MSIKLKDLTRDDINYLNHYRKSCENSGTYLKFCFRPAGEYSSVSELWKMECVTPYEWSAAPGTSTMAVPRKHITKKWLCEKFGADTLYE